MTTIAYRDGVLAVDSLGTNGAWIIARKHQKLWRLPDGSIAAGTGTLSHVVAHMEYLMGRGNKPDLDDYCILQVAKNGVFVHEAGHRFQVFDDFISYGSGSPAAMAAMFCGKSAIEALDIAALLDPNTGGEIVSGSVE